MSSKKILYRWPKSKGKDAQLHRSLGKHNSKPHETPQGTVRMAAIERENKRASTETDTLYVASANVKWCSHCGKRHGDSSEKLNTELPYDPAVPAALGFYP